MQEELAHIVESAGLALDINDMTQVLKAIQKLTLSRANPFADIKSDGAAAISTALTNLGLGAGAPPIGIPFYWPSATMPNSVMPEWANMVFLKWNGASFSAAAYPKLAQVIPSLTLVETRGEFIRVWDDGRGVDTGRAMLSAQVDAFAQHSHRFLETYAIAGFDNTGGRYVVGADSAGAVTQIASNETNIVGGSENRPRNIAFNFLVRAK
ncbi:TPA: integrase [Escherichia coli]|nr:integrase [Escherichia coli]